MRATFALLCFNQENFVREAIEAALAQTYEALDIVISDDCSTDDTWAAINAAVAKYDGPHIIRLSQNKTNMGVGAHTDKVIRETETDLVILAAGDDISLPQRTAEVVKAFSAPNVTCVASSIFSGGKIERPLPVNASDPRTAIMRGDPLFGAALAFRKTAISLFSKVPDTVRYGEDILLPFRAALLGDIAVLKEPLVIYRRHAASLMGGLSLQKEPKIYVAALRKTLASLAIVRAQQIESIYTLHRLGLINLEQLMLISTPIANLMEREEPLRALLFREPYAFWKWLKAALSFRLSPKEAVKTLINGLAPAFWHRYTTRYAIEAPPQQ